jgi:hypothetical protein
VTVDASDIIAQVSRHMGSKRAPRKIYFVDELPRTETGKVRRTELPRLLGLDQQASVASPGASPMPMSATALSPLQAALAGLWCTVLRMSKIGVNDDFFQLGGDAVRGARLLGSVKAVFGVELSLAALSAEAGTVAGMARAIEAARSADAHHE